MKKIKRAGRTVGVERIAVMAAINMAHDLLALKRDIAIGAVSAERIEPTDVAPSHDETLRSAEESLSENDSLAAPAPAQTEASNISQQLHALTERLAEALRADETQTTPETTSNATSLENKNTDTTNDTESNCRETDHVKTPSVDTRHKNEAYGDA